MVLKERLHDGSGAPGGVDRIDRLGDVVRGGRIGRVDEVDHVGGFASEFGGRTSGRVQSDDLAARAWA